MKTTLFEVRLEEGKLHVVLNTTLYLDEIGAAPVGWGIVLAHVAQHMARAHADVCSRAGSKPSPEQVLEDILRVFKKEVHEPMDKLHEGETIIEIATEDEN